MAITIHQSPASITPTYNDMVFVVGSTNYLQPNFKYIADVWYNGVFKMRFKIPARQDTYGVIDVSRVIESLITDDMSNDDYGILQCPNMSENFLVKFGEEYGTTPVEHLNLTTSSVITAFNASLDTLDFLSYTSSDYNLSGSTSKFLSNSGSIQDIHENESAWLHFFSTTGANTARMLINTYNTAGASIQSLSIVNNFASASGFFRIGVGPYQLNNIDAGDISIGSQPIITSSVAKYTVLISTTGFTPKSIGRTYNVDCLNPKYDNYRIHWLNKLGGYDSFNFELISRKNTSVERKIYKKNLGKLTGTSYAYSAMDAQDTVFGLTSKSEIRVTSDWVTDVESIWLEELFTSPKVFYEKSAGILIPIVITNTSFEQKKKQNDKLINYELSFSLANTNSRQRG